MAHKWPSPFGVLLQIAISALSNFIGDKYKAIFSMPYIRASALDVKVDAMPHIQNMYIEKAKDQGYDCTIVSESGCAWEFRLVDPNNKNFPIADSVYTSIYTDLKDYEDANGNLIDVAILQDSKLAKWFSVG